MILSRTTCSQAAALLICATAFACAHPAPVVRRVEAQTQVDLSGRWNDTDAHLTSEALIYECFAAAWLPQFTKAQSRTPSVRIGSIVNQTDEHLDAQMFIKNIERAMINSGKVQVLVQAGAESDALAQEDARGGRALPPQQGAELKVPGQLRADYVAAVRVASSLDQVEGREVRLYKINFELIDSDSGAKAWIGDYEVKKLVSRKKWAL